MACLDLRDRFRTRDAQRGRITSPVVAASLGAAWRDTERFYFHPTWATHRQCYFPWREVALTSSSLEIHRFVLGPWMTNCYVVADNIGRCWIVDAGFDPEAMISFVQNAELAPQGIALTHAHVDHIAGLESCRAAWPGLPILIHEAERQSLVDPRENLSAALATPVVAPAATSILEPGGVIEMGGCPFTIHHTPGHSPGGVTLHAPDAGIAIVGDTLFAGSIGRTDFPHSDPEALMRSIQEVLIPMPDATRVLPGHGAETTIESERKNNPFLQ